MNASGFLINPAGYRSLGEPIPDYMAPGLIAYIERGAEPGGFLAAVLANDLKGAFDRADNANLKALGSFVGYLFNEAPALCWGDKTRVDAWIKAGGMAGMSAKAAA